MKREWWPRLLGWVSLTGIVLLLVVYSTIETYHHHPVLSSLKVMLLIGIIFSVIRETGRIFDASLNTPYEWGDLFDFFGVFFGGMITFFLQTELGLNPVLASGVVGLVGGIFLKKIGPALFCGSFVGMASPAMFYVLPGVVLSSLMAGIVFVITRDLFIGIGGKLGTIAFSGCLMSSWVLGYVPMSDPVPGWNVGLPILLSSLLGAVVTFILHHRMRLGPVISSALIGVVSGMLFPLIFGHVFGLLLAVITFCASFAGMAARDQIAGLWEMAAAGVLCGLLFMFTSPHLGGAGGKLGTIAFASLLGLIGWRQLIGRISAAAQRRK